MFLATTFHQKSQEAHIPCISLFPCLKTYDIAILPYADRIRKK